MLRPPLAHPTPLAHTSPLSPLPASTQVRAWRGPGGGGGRPPGVRDPAPYGIPLRPALINRSLRGRAAALYWHTDDRWWMVTFGEGAGREWGRGGVTV